MILSRKLAVLYSTFVTCQSYLKAVLHENLQFVASLLESEARWCASCILSKYRVIVALFNRLFYVGLLHFVTHAKVIRNGL